MQYQAVQFLLRLASAQAEAQPDSRLLSATNRPAIGQPATNELEKEPVLWPEENASY